MVVVIVVVVDVVVVVAGIFLLWCLEKVYLFVYMYLLNIFRCTNLILLMRAIDRGSFKPTFGPIITHTEP